jgi:hypothetical protein
MKGIHTEIMTGGDTYLTVAGLDSMIAAGEASNPFSGLSAYDPTTRIASVDDALELFSSYIHSIDPLSNLDEYYKKVKDLLKEEGENTDDELMEAYEKIHSSERIPFQRVLAEYDSQMADIGGTMTSAFVVGKANLEEGFQRTIDKTFAQVKLELLGRESSSRYQYMMLLFQLMDKRIAAQQTLFGATLEADKLAVALFSEQTKVDADLDRNEATFPFTLYEYLMNALASINGAVSKSWSQENIKPEGNVLQGALGGAMSGAAAGVPLGPIGVGVGAVLGGLLGGFSQS